MKTISSRFKGYLLFFIPLFIIEILFRYDTQLVNHPFYLMRSILFAIFFAWFLYLVDKKFKSLISNLVILGIVWFFAGYYFFQTNIHHYYGYFFSIRFILKGMPNVGEYTFDFFKTSSILSYSFFFIALLFSTFFLIDNKSNKRRTYFRHAFVLGFLSFIVFIGSLFMGESKSQFESSFNLFLKPYYQELAIDQLGLMPFFFSDLRYLVYQDQKIIEPSKDPIKEVPVPIIQSLKRVIDDQAWRLKAKEETNPAILGIDNYLLSRKIDDKNEFTGQYENMNLIYFLVEAFDMIAIHPDLTPTLFKLKSNGTYFDEFYSPQYNCATAESELMSLSSVYPVIGTCTMSAYYERASSQNLYRLFKEKGYVSASFHNWNDQFYPRSIIHPVLGSDSYHDLKEMIPSNVSGWQSDLTMMENLVPMLNQETENPFFAYVITSSTHLPYDTDTHLSMKHREKVKTVFPDAPYEIQNYLSKAIELDLAMTYLIDNLNEIDDTVLILFSDHRPLRMPQGYLNDFSDIDRFSMNDMDRTPMMIYHPEQIAQTISKKSSTIDLAPTIANLFNLNYDPRLFMGQDLFGKEDPVVIFQNGNFYDQNGYFSATKGGYTPKENGLEITYDISLVKEKLEVSSAIYLEKYFEQRREYFK